MASRKKRSSKAVDYAAVSNPFSSDDDFSDFTPPAKKKKEKAKPKEKARENIAADCEVESGNVQTEEVVKEGDSKHRKSLEERKFQREMDEAMKLSAHETGETTEFQGFNKDDDGEPSTITITTSSDEEPRSPPSPLFSPERIVAAVDVHATFSGTDTRVENVVNEAKETARRTVEEAPSPPGFSLLAGGARRRKKVNFVEDDSDEWNSDMEEIKALSDDTDQSDFCPSPLLKKKKKDAKTKKAPTRPTPPSKTSKASESKSKKVAAKLPSKLKDVSVHVASTVGGKQGASRPKVASPSSSASSAGRSFITSPVRIPTPSTPKCTGSARVGLVGKAFKSPTTESSSSSAPQNSSSLSTTGLRLGLSRRASVKPLHPSASVR